MMVRCQLETALASALWIAVLAASASAGERAAPLHPPIPLLDHDGDSVTQTGKPISTMRSCAGCHDTAYIAAHNYHVSLGSDERTAVGTASGQRAWDYSPGPFGRWNPLTYRYLTPPGDSRLDLGVAEWIQLFGWRHVGGGPAVYGHGRSRTGTPARREQPDGQQGPSSARREQPDGQECPSYDPCDPNSQVLDASTGKPRGWDWKQSGVAELNCFLCHAAAPDNASRSEELAAGKFQWAVTATLAKTGLVTKTPDGWKYTAEAFDAKGNVSADRIGIREPTSLHCGQCHGVTHRGSEPLVLDLSLRQWATATKGQVFSAQRISDSAVNMAHKTDLARPWDVHAEAMLDCQSCHFSLNDPSAFEASPRNRPAHLAYEPRRLPLDEYLRRPSHQFAKGQTAQGTTAQHLAGSMRRCDDCHHAEQTHDWLPYVTVHLDRLSCEACHIPQSHAPAVRAVDWTLIDAQGEPRPEWRGIDGDVSDSQSLVTGFRPVLLPRRELDGRTHLVPHNLITAWYWVEGGPAPRPVRQVDLQRAFLDDGRLHADLLAVLDANRDGKLDVNERVLDTDEKVAVARRRLEAVGLVEPHIVGEVQPYGIHHGVGPAKWATRACDTCHAADSRLAEPMTLAALAPQSGTVKPVGDSIVELSGAIATDSNRSFVYRPDTRAAELYVLGHDRWSWIDLLGSVALFGVVIGAGTHAVLRFRTRR